MADIFDIFIIISCESNSIPRVETDSLTHSPVQIRAIGYNSLNFWIKSKFAITQSTFELGANFEGPNFHQKNKMAAKN